MQPHHLHHAFLQSHLVYDWALQQLMLLSQPLAQQQSAPTLLLRGEPTNKNHHTQ